MIRADEVFRDSVLISRTILDSDAGTFTREVGGNVIETRPLTVDEIAALTPPPPVPNPAADALDAAADQAEQSLIADVRDLAVQLRSAADALRGQ